MSAPTSGAELTGHEGGWFVVDGEVRHLDDVRWTLLPSDGRSAPGEVRARVVGGEPSGYVGRVLLLASTAALNGARRSTVRRLWTTPIAIVVSAVVFAGLELSGLPWRADPARQVLVGVGACIPVLAVALGTWWFVTRDATGRVVVAMGGRRTRQQYETQRASAGGSD